jgi:hypothetical protein
MKSRFLSALAAAVALTVAAPAYAETSGAQVEFRQAAPQSFSAEDLQRYGLSAEEAAHGVALQEQGYTVVALTPEEAEAYRAGAISTQEWILIGVGVLIILAIA